MKFSGLGGYIAAVVLAHGAHASGPIEPSPIAIRKDYPGQSWVQLDCDPDRRCALYGAVKGRVFSYSSQVLEDLGTVIPSSIALFSENAPPGMIVVEMEVMCEESRNVETFKRLICLQSVLLDREGISFTELRTVEVFDPEG